ncbi:MAG: hypothetical protein O2782_16590 [bacterium]|nr:hypothetical protein [bacterium]
MLPLLHPVADEPGADIALPDVRYAGRCPLTGDELSIGPTAAVMVEAVRLRRFLDAHRDAADGFSTRHLLEPGAGKMFGVMLCRDTDGQLGTLRAFSGEWETWEAPAGWVPSSGHLEEYVAERSQTETAVAVLTQQIRDLQALPTSKPLRRQIETIKIERGHLSRALTDRMHAAYRFDNVLGEVLPLTQVEVGGSRPPTGMGDCCAPKLLQAAIRGGLAPLGMVEFWWGSSSAVHPRVEGVYYDACRSKCYPILGFLLRGMEAASVTKL